MLAQSICINIIHVEDEHIITQRYVVTSTGWYSYVLKRRYTIETDKYDRSPSLALADSNSIPHLNLTPNGG